MGMPDFGPQQPAGCEGKIDFLFVISAQGTMQPMQERLVASFPGFMDAIEEQLPEFDVHILVANPNEKFGLVHGRLRGLYMTDCDPQGQPPYLRRHVDGLRQKDRRRDSPTPPARERLEHRRCELDNELRYMVGR
jgi:hypothetical protein